MRACLAEGVTEATGLGEYRNNCFFKYPFTIFTFNLSAKRRIQIDSETLAEPNLVSQPNEHVLTCL